MAVASGDTLAQGVGREDARVASRTGVLATPGHRQGWRRR
jgi:hypothetical protein